MVDKDIMIDDLTVGGNAYPCKRSVLENRSRTH